MKRFVVAVVLAAFALPITAQNYPNKTVRIIGPFAAGGGGDILARMIAQKLNEVNGQYFIVENRAGATGTIGAAFVAKAPADGYALIMHSSSTYIAPFMYRSISYDPVKSFAPVVNCVSNPLYLVGSPALPAKNVRELIALAKKHPGEVAFGSPGLGSGGHLVMEMFNLEAGTRMLHVPFKGSVPALTAVMGGEVSLGITTILTAQPFVKAGKLRGYAVTGASRSSTVPDVPTMIESGLPGFQAILWTGLLATTGTPSAIINQLNASVNRILSASEMKDWLLQTVGGEYSPNTPEQFGELLAVDLVRWQKAIKYTGVQLD
jgi:tripartite-type tricarboxylate transporter receptor subunit TctC